MGEKQKNDDIIFMNSSNIEKQIKTSITQYMIINLVI